MKKVIKDILVDSLNEIEPDKDILDENNVPQGIEIQHFIIGMAAAIILKSANYIRANGETPTIRKCVENLALNPELVAQIHTILRKILTAKVNYEGDSWVNIQTLLVNFDIIEQNLHRIFKDEPDEDEELD